MAVIVDPACARCWNNRKTFSTTSPDERELRPAGSARRVEADVAQGCYKFGSYTANEYGGQSANSLKNLTLMGSGAILTEVIQAAQPLAAQGVGVTVYSVTSWSELAREGRACLQRRLNGEGDAPTPFITAPTARQPRPIIAATDCVVAVPKTSAPLCPRDGVL